MRDTQSEAPQLADVVDVFDAQSEHMPLEIYGDISSELRRLHEVNKAEDIRNFLMANFNSVTFAKGANEPDDGDVYSLTAHDLLSAFWLWEAFGKRPKRQPLTDACINEIAESMPGGLAGFMKGWGWQQFARAIEAAHGIGAEHDA